MPSGYTAGIIDGKINDFTTFAILCSRAFMVHLREEPLDSKYKKREPSTYHKNAIKEAKKQLEEAGKFTDQELIDNEVAKLTKDKEYHTENKALDEQNKAKVTTFLALAKAYEPPTENHKGIAAFMVKQLEETLDYDCDSNYHATELEKIDGKLDNIDANALREALKAAAQYNIDYHTKEHEADKKRCAEHNKWYKDYLKSLGISK